MIINYSVSGYKTFFDEINFSMEANKKIKNKDNILSLNANKEILKSSIIYGPNNTGKSSFIESIKLLKEIINKEMVDSKIFSDPFNYNYYLKNEEKIIKYKIEFFLEREIYKYYLDFKYDYGIISESLFVNNKEIFDRNKVKQKITNMTETVKLIREYKNKLIVCTLPKKYIHFSNAIKLFFDKITILDENDILLYFKMNKVVELISSNDNSKIEKFNNLIKSADISIEKLNLNEELNIKDDLKELKLVSIYKMKEREKYMPTVISDSSGSKRFMTYIAYILDSLEKGGIIIIDEIDNSLHTLLTKNILSIFNNKKNTNAQLICTSHDLLLLDTEFLFRKDQIWFTYKDSSDIYFYCLNDFKCNKDDGIRNNTMVNYLKGMFGALPHPNIEEILYEEKNNSEM